ncbi:hypothetical protein GCK72_014739 [Caenorhabditis remanei]|uniref:Uncharacterized protein n=1 Tax=Caenorhabditis remanei TaxID=31234 RepID=A0A6A5GUL4_CAERE|nr:hypothetical protein GCK72_014739 [Caenorhabditis remanei]KAF1758281.1 hypothetical protein GCK72_014739 [Caenorhabditis remanei]
MMSMLNQEKSRERLLEIAKVYGIEGYDGFCTSFSIESLDFDGMECHMSNVNNPKEPSGMVPEDALKNVLKLCCRTFFTFWTKSTFHHHSRLTHGGYVKILVNLERLMNGVCKMKGEMQSVTESMISTITRRLFVGEGRINLFNSTTLVNVANNVLLNLEETERSDIVEKEENIGMVEDERDETMVEATGEKDQVEETLETKVDPDEPPRSDVSMEPHSAEASIQLKRHGIQHLDINNNAHTTNESTHPDVPESMCVDVTSVPKVSGNWKMEEGRRYRKRKRRRRIQKILLPHRLDRSEQARMAMNGKCEFSIVNVNRAASYSAEKVLDDLLASIGIIGEHHLISCVRLPMKRFGHVLTFSIRSPKDSKILNECIGSEKIWYSRFNGIFMANANVFIWTPITVEEAVQGVLATSIKQFDDSYQLPESKI